MSLNSKQPGDAREGTHLFRRIPLGDLLVALGAAGLGLFFLLGTRAIRVLPSYARIGPRFFPYVVGGGLIGAGLLLAWQALRGQAATPVAEEGVDPDAPSDWWAVSWIVSGLILNVWLMERAGYILATTFLFTLTAYGMGSRRHSRNVLSGFILAIMTYLAFTRLLDLHLPAGWLALLVS